MKIVYNHNIDNINKQMNIKFINKNPFTVFKIDNFLSDIDYQIIDRNFEKILANKNQNDIAEIDNLKLNIKIGDTKNNDLIEKNESIALIKEKFSNKLFLSSLLNKLRYRIFMSRINDRKSLIKLFKFKKISFFNEKSKQNVFDFLFTKYKININFSYIFNGGEITPHTDAPKKLLSFMLYFPESSKLSKNDELKEKQIGTSFWESTDQNFNNKHLRNEDKIEFKNKFKKFITLPYEKKTLYGFIKNKFSWHTVEPFNINEDYVRRSININIYI